MLALLGSLLGLLGALAPRLIQLFESRQNHKQELEMIDKHAETQLRLAEVVQAGKMAEIDARAAVQGDMMAFAAAMKPTGIAWVDALNGVVRPLLTVSFFALYAAVKAAQFYLITADGAAPANALVLLWGDEDWAAWAAIVTFWFGSRTFNKERGR